MARSLPPCSVPGGQWRNTSAGRGCQWLLYVNGRHVGTVRRVNNFGWFEWWTTYELNDGTGGSSDEVSRRDAMAFVERKVNARGTVTP